MREDGVGVRSTTQQVGKLVDTVTYGVSGMVEVALFSRPECGSTGMRVSSTSSYALAVRMGDWGLISGLLHCHTMEY